MKYCHDKEILQVCCRNEKNISSKNLIKIIKYNHEILDTVNVNVSQQIRQYQVVSKKFRFYF